MIDDFSYETVYKTIKNRWDRIAKPIDSMGRFEELICRIGAVQNNADVDISKRCVIVMCADNGIVEEGISQSGQEVTYSVASWMGHNCSSVCRLAGPAGVDVVPVDIGMNSDTSPEGVRNCKIAKGTKNFLKAPAMSEDECRKAIETGISLVEECSRKGYKLIATGEMGIGNTTTSAALSELLLGNDRLNFAGRGAGLDDEKLKKKTAVISEAKELYGGKEAFEILCSVGGFDIAGLAGVFIGGAKYNIPVIIDGMISAIAAVYAEKLVPGSKKCMIPSHISKEPAAMAALDYLGLKELAVIHADMALGEGTGALMLIPMLDLAVSMYQNAFRFEETTVEQYQRFEPGQNE